MSKRCAEARPSAGRRRTTLGSIHLSLVTQHSDAKASRLTLRSIRGRTVSAGRGERVSRLRAGNDVQHEGSVANRSRDRTMSDEPASPGSSWARSTLGRETVDADHAAAARRDPDRPSSVQSPPQWGRDRRRRLRPILHWNRRRSCSNPTDCVSPGKVHTRWWHGCRTRACSSYQAAPRRLPADAWRSAASGRHIVLRSSRRAHSVVRRPAVSVRSLRA